MRYRKIGKSEIQGSVITLGTWAIGGGNWWGPTEDEESIRTIHAALDVGINMIDTAPAYGRGRAEEVIGQAIQGKRDKVVLATKCGLWWRDDRGSFFFEMDGLTIRRSLRPDTLREELELSLKRLGTEYIDLYQTHWQAIEPEKTPIADTMETLMQMKAEGKIRAIGVSNASVEDMEQYQAAGQIDSAQPRYSMLDRKIEAEIVPYCIKNRISLLVYTPLEQGLLTGRYRMDTLIPENEFRNRLPWFKPENRKRVLDMLDGWKDLQEKYGCTLGQLVLAWTIEQPGITFALTGARHPEQIIENAGAGSIELSAADIARMRKDVEELGEPAA